MTCDEILLEIETIDTDVYNLMKEEHTDKQVEKKMNRRRELVQLLIPYKNEIDKLWRDYYGS
jgi:hypothetical protein